MADIHKMLQTAIERKKRDQDVGGFIKEFSKELASTISPDEISRNVESKITDALEPLLRKLVESNQLNTDAIERAMVTAIQNVRIDVPEVRLPTINVPTPQVSVTVPPIRIPDIKMPDEMNIGGWVSLMTNGKVVGYNNPLPVELRDSQGNPLKLFENLTSIVGGGGGGGKSDYLTIKSIQASAFSAYENADNRIRVSLETG